tara:strand:+ start:788 stop:1855 length:1068 start_codon:yes stop_codon:yes gene_type:complete
MRLIKAIVDGTFNASNNIKIAATTVHGGERPIDVFYTSPFNSIVPGKGGLTAYPRTGDVILVASTDDGPDIEYFYISTIVGSLPGNGNALPNYPKGSTKFATGNSYKDTVGIRDHHEGGMEFVYESSDGGSPGVTRRSYAQLYAGSNKIKLSRSSSTGGILLQTGDQSPRVSLKMSGQKAQFGQGPNAFVANAYGNMYLNSTVGNIKLTNSSGGDSITLENKGRRDIDGSLLDTPMNRRKGNVNITSMHNSININAHAYLPLTPPKVFVRTSTKHRDGVVQLKTGGTVEIVANDLIATVGTNPVSGKITIWASKGIDIFTETGDINISAPAGNVNLQPVIPAGIDFIPTLDYKLT